MRLNADAVKQVTDMLYITDARNVFGEEGEKALASLVNKIRTFFSHLSPEHVRGGIMFVQEVESSTADALFSNSAGTLKKELREVELPALLDILAEGRALVVRATRTECFDVLITESLPDPTETAKKCIVFVNRGGEDQFHIGGQNRKLPPFVHGIASNFAEPTIADLAEALRLYGLDACKTACPILAEAWELGRDGPRLVFKNKPEAIMRTSLCRFLAVRLGANASVRPEHNTDESKPVDIVVNWFASTSRALLEIKWLGKSLTLTRNNDGTPRFTEYSDGRAREGYEQLADYLDRETTTDPKAALRGYLVVFDGRRRGVTAPGCGVTREDGEHYRNREVSYSENGTVQRRDMEAPIRYFLEPRESHYLSGGGA